FDIKAEPDKVREEYGRNSAGQRMLLARRLVESGVRFVTLTYGGWDHHDNIKNAVSRQVPDFDKAFAALIRDLAGRGMLDSTLVMVTSEFGRTPPAASLTSARFPSRTLPQPFIINWASCRTRNSSLLAIVR